MFRRRFRAGDATARCVRGKDSPQCTGEDGRFVQEVLYAGYRSAGIGAKVELPYRPSGIERPIDLWRPK